VQAGVGPLPGSLAGSTAIDELNTTLNRILGLYHQEGVAIATRALQAASEFEGRKVAHIFRTEISGLL
jgi:hypothetical protein